jgi:membrane protease YdiL (CAAX protease family)
LHSDDSKIGQETAILLALFPPIAIALVNGFYLPGLTSNPVLFWTADACQFVLIPALCFRFLMRQGITPRDYGFRSLNGDGSTLENIGLIAFVSFLFWLAFDPIHSILSHFFWQSASPPPISQAMPKLLPWRALLIFYCALTAGLIEEPVFRSLPWLYLKKRLHSPEWPYVLTTSVLFGSVHWEQGTAVALATGFLGFIAALLYISIRNIWPFVIAHFLVDLWEFHDF